MSASSTCALALWLHHPPARPQQQHPPPPPHLPHTHTHKSTPLPGAHLRRPGLLQQTLVMLTLGQKLLRGGGGVGMGGKRVYFALACCPPFHPASRPGRAPHLRVRLTPPQRFLAPVRYPRPPAPSPSPPSLLLSVPPRLPPWPRALPASVPPAGPPARLLWRRAPWQRCRHGLPPH